MIVNGTKGPEKSAIPERGATQLAETDSLSLASPAGWREDLGND
jgi:hypothetical protein